MKIVLLFGGSSSERLVSLSSSIAIYKALIDLGHEVISINPSEAVDSWDILSITSEEFAQNDYSNQPKDLELVMKQCLNINSINPDLVFIGLHGGYGEDGFIQSIFDKLNLRYTGSDSISSKIAMDKNLSKRILQSNQCSTAKWICVSKSNDYFLAKSLRFPVVVKPSNSGSSVALSIVEQLNDLPNAIDRALKEDKDVLIEEFIEGKELTVSIIGDKAYPIVEIRPKGGIYDYLHKYTAGMTEYVCPAELEDTLKNTIQEDALRVYRALGLSVYARIDYRLNRQNEFFCLEANTLPGMTSTSLVPKSIKAEGYDFNYLIQKIIDESLKRYNQ